MIKGKYVATVTLDFHIDSHIKDEFLIKDDVIFIESFKNSVNESVKELLEEEVGDDATVTVVQQMCDLYQETEEA